MGGHQLLRALLESMLMDGVPLLVSVGRDSFAKAHENYETAAKRLGAGSVLMLVDDQDNIVGMGLPMGELTYVPLGQAGFLPLELKEAEESRSAFEFWVRLACVAPYPALSKAAWWRGDPVKNPGVEEFNWAIDYIKSEGCVNLNSQGSTLYLPKVVSARNSCLAPACPTPAPRLVSRAVPAAFCAEPPQLAVWRHVPARPWRVPRGVQAEAEPADVRAQAVHGEEEAGPQDQAAEGAGAGKRRAGQRGQLLPVRDNIGLVWACGGLAAGVRRAC